MRRALVPLACLSLVGCPEEKSPTSPTPAPQPEVAPRIAAATVTDLAPPTALGSVGPALHRDGEGKIWLSFVDTAKEPPSIRLTSYTSGTWSEPRLVVQSPDLFVNWADVPRTTSFADGTLAVAWPQRFEDGRGYGLRWSISDDDGATWSEPQWLPEDQAGPEYGFVSFAPDEGDTVRVFWLDGRSAAGHGAGQTQLRSALLHADGTVSDRRLVDDRVCDCCQTSATATPDGPIVVYRDRSAGEVRDIRLATALTTGDGKLVADDGWKIEGCPVNGPATATAGERTAVAWFTGAKDRARVQIAWTGSGGFGQASRVDLGGPLGRVALAIVDGSAHVAWVEKDASDGRRVDLLLRSVPPNGPARLPRRIAASSPSRASGFPQLLPDEGRILVAWTEVDDQERTTVRMGAVPL